MSDGYVKLWNITIPLAPIPPENGWPVGFNPPSTGGSRAAGWNKTLDPVDYYITSGGPVTKMPPGAIPSVKDKESMRARVALSSIATIGMDVRGNGGGGGILELPTPEGFRYPKAVNVSQYLPENYEFSGVYHNSAMSIRELMDTHEVFEAVKEHFSDVLDFNRVVWFGASQGGMYSSMVAALSGKSISTKKIDNLMMISQREITIRRILLLYILTQMVLLKVLGLTTLE